MHLTLYISIVSQFCIYKVLILPDAPPPPPDVYLTQPMFLMI